MTHLTFYTWAQKEAQRYGEKWAKKWAREVVYSKILQEIPQILDRHAIVIDKRRFISWKKFLHEYFSKGIFHNLILSHFPVTFFVCKAQFSVCKGLQFLKRGVSILLDFLWIVASKEFSVHCFESAVEMFLCLNLFQQGGIYYI